MPAVLIGLVVVIALFVLIGGAIEVGKVSGPYRRDVNRSYVAQGTVLVGQSNQTGAQLRSLMGRMATLRQIPLRRTTLQQQLDALASASSQDATSAAALSPPSPTVSGFTASLADRAQAVAEVRAAVDGLLGLGQGDQALLPADRAAAEITSAGALLARADQTYAGVRRRFLAAPGAASLPRSVWVTDPQLWASGSVQALVQDLTSSPTLAAVHRVVLLTDAIRIVPAAPPPVRATAGGVSVVPPTKTLQVAAVVANEGNVRETGVVVSAQVVPQGAGAPDSTSEKVSVAPAGSVAVTFPELKVAPGDTYTLTVSVVRPASQVNLAHTSKAFTIRVAPAAPPPTTTTAPAHRPASTGKPAAS